MENTVEAILAHGDQAPSLLVTNLKSGKANEARDSELARQWQHKTDKQTNNNISNDNFSNARDEVANRVAAGLLRVPGYQPSSASPSSVMDQDRLWLECCKMNFSRKSWPIIQSLLIWQMLVDNSQEYREEAPCRDPPPPKRTQINLHQSLNTFQNGTRRQKRCSSLPLSGTPESITWPLAAGNSTTTSRAGVSENTAAANETRGLLDDNDDNGEEMEMSFAATNK
ncbi:hypothetical protein MHU86_14499 [Fragilaria crotonensis]|nr:hypothetical protein MHU86_14499 [Fragilaria crotonensis]